jgi:hypothetical protein
MLGFWDCAPEGSAAGNPAAVLRPEAGALKLSAGNSHQQRVVSGFASFAPHKSLLRIKLDHHQLQRRRRPS